MQHEVERSPYKVLHLSSFIVKILFIRMNLIKKKKTVTIFRADALHIIHVLVYKC